MRNTTKTIMKMNVPERIMEACEYAIGRAGNIEDDVEYGGIYAADILLATCGICNSLIQASAGFRHDRGSRNVAEKISSALKTITELSGNLRNVGNVECVEECFEDIRDAMTSDCDDTRRMSQFRRRMNFFFSGRNGL